jgi:hypothetical protein
MWVWITIGAVAVLLLAVALFRARDEWPGHRKNATGRRSDGAIGETAQWVSRLGNPSGR